MKKFLSFLAFLVVSKTTFSQVVSPKVKTQNMEATTTLTLGGKLVNKFSDDSTLSNKSSKSLITEGAVKRYVDNKAAYISVLDFGIKGDSATNNTVNLQAAVNYAASVKRTLYFPNGVYKTNAITVPSNLTILGESQNAVIRAITITATNYQTGCLFKTSFTGVSNVSFSTITLDGNATVFSSGEAAILNLFNSTSLSFVSVKVINGLSCGLSFYNVNTVTVRDCYFEKFGWSAIHGPGVSNGIFSSNITKEWSLKALNTYPSWEFNSLNNYNVIIDKNYFLNTSGAGEFAIEAFGGWCYNFNITSNLFDANGYKGNGISAAFKSSTISNNKFVNGTGGQRCGIEAHLDSSMISNNIINNGAIALITFGIVSHKVTNAKIVDNIINTSIVDDRSIMVGGTTGTDTIVNFEITRNTINTASNLETIFIGFYGLYSNTKDGLIQDNVLKSIGNGNGLRVAGNSLTNIRIKNNTIVGGYWGIHLDNGNVKSNVIVEDNKISGFSSAYYALPFTENVTLVNNEILGVINNTANQYLLRDLNTAPSSSTDTGTKGEIRVTATYIYVCTATNTWVRSALATW